MISVQVIRLFTELDVRVLEHGRRPLEINCHVIMLTTEVPSVVVLPKHAQLDRCPRTSRSVLAGRNVVVCLTEVWCRVVRFQRKLASCPTLADIFFRCCDVTEEGCFARLFENPSLAHTTGDRMSVTAVFPVTFADRCSVVSLTSGFLRMWN